MSTRLRYLYRAYRYRFRIDPAEIRFVRQSLRPGQIAVDIGCHKGAYTYWMRRRVGPSGIVYAFEPQPRQVAYLREAFSAMRYDNVEVVPMAVSDKCGHMPLYMPADSTHAATLEARSEYPQNGSDSPLTVDVTTLDNFFTSTSRKAGANAADCHAPHFLKIDVEGHELSVLKGAQRTLEAYHPTILLECESRHRADGNTRTVFNLLESLDYTGSFFYNRRRYPLAEFDPAVHQRLNSNTDKLPKSYANNFAFEFATVARFSK